MIASEGALCHEAVGGSSTQCLRCSADQGGNRAGHQGLHWILEQTDTLYWGSDERTCPVGRLVGTALSSVAVQIAAVCYRLKSAPASTAATTERRHPLESVRRAPPDPPVIVINLRGSRQLGTGLQTDLAPPDVRTSQHSALIFNPRFPSTAFPSRKRCGVLRLNFD